MGFRVDDKGGHYRPEVHEDGDASKTKDPKAKGESVADKKARGQATGDEVVTGGQPGQPPVPNNLAGQTPQPPDDVKNVGGVGDKNKQDVKNALLMYDALADISFLLKDVKDTKREDKLADTKELAKELDKATADMREFNEKFEKVLDLFLNEFGQDQQQMCQQQMGPQDQNPELMRIMTEELGMTPNQASDFINAVREGGQPGLALALSLAVIIAGVEMRDTRQDAAAPGGDGVQAADGQAPAGEGAGPPVAEGEVPIDVVPVEDGGAAEGAATAAAPEAPSGGSLTSGEEDPSKIVFDDPDQQVASAPEPDPALVALAEAAHDYANLHDFFPGFAENSALGDTLSAAGGAAGFTAAELGDLAGKSPDEIRAAIHEKDEEQINKLRAEFSKVLREIVASAVVAKAIDMTMKTSKKRIEQTFKPQLEPQSQPGRRIS